MKRRDFLRDLTAAGLSLPIAIPAIAGKGNSKSSEERQKRKEDHQGDSQYDCIVIGGGIAGLTVARDLTIPKKEWEKKWGFTSKRVLVLEGRDRLGGRTHTHYDWGQPRETGAEYIHTDPFAEYSEKEFSYLWEELVRYNIRAKKYDGGDLKFFHKNWGKDLHGPFSVGTKIGILLAPFLIDGIKVPDGMADISAEDLMKKEGYDERPEVYDANKAIISGYLGAEMRDVSVGGFWSDRFRKILNNEDEYQVQGGFSRLIQELAKSIGKDRIRMNQVISRIEHGPQGVAVYTQGGEVFRAKSAVTTVPVGVLKAHKIQFAPELHPRKQLAISALGDAPHAKVGIEFTRRFWGKDMGGLHRLDPDRRATRSYFIPSAGSSKKTPVLNGIFSDDCHKIYGATEWDIGMMICRDLDDMFPKWAPTSRFIARNSDGTPRIHKKTWYDDPFTLGGSSYIQYGHHQRIQPKHVRSVLANPHLTPGLFWAGEGASTFASPSSVHGAHSSGLRAALEVSHFLASGELQSNSEMKSRYKELYQHRFEAPWRRLQNVPHYRHDRVISRRKDTNSLIYSRRKAIIDE